MKNKCLSMFFLASILLSYYTSKSEVAEAQQPLFVQGDVKWESGSPATYVELRLVRGNDIASTTFTDSNGRYAFFGVSGNPNNYLVFVYIGDQKRGEARLLGVPLGGDAPTIVIR